MLSPELFFILVALIVVFALILGTALLVGGIIFYAKGVARENLKVWKELSEKLNLKMSDPEDFCLTGKYNDLEVEVKTRAKMVRMYSRMESYQFTSCLVKFPRPLKLSLKLKYPKENITRGLMIGQPEFDTNFDASCSDSKTLRNLLLSDKGTNRNLLSDIFQTKRYIETTEHNSALVKVRHKETDPTLLVTDNSVFIEFRTKFGNDSEQVKKLIDFSTYLTKQVYVAHLNLD